jgi:hypothetical protein
MTELSELLEDCDRQGIYLRASGVDGLTINAPRDAISAGLLARLKARKDDLLSLLSSNAVLAPIGQTNCPQTSKGGYPYVRSWDEVGSGRNATLATGECESTAELGPLDHCDRCGSRSVCDVSIHDGQSVRRDCARCHRFIGWMKWYGK